MTDRLSGQRCYRFGPFVLDAHKSLLWRGDVHVALTPKTVDVLSVLVAEAGQVVTKDELLRRVWPSTVVEENSLAKCISVLRKALAERRDQHDYIVTVPGQGYRFVASVERLDRCPETVVAAPVPTPGPALTADAAGEVAGSERPRPPRRLAVIAVPAVAAAVLVIAWLAGLLPRSGAAHPVARRLTSGLGLQHQPAWSPDGAHVAYADTGAGNSDIWVQAIAESEPRQLTTSAAQEWQPAWSPDGRSIAFRSEENGGGLYVIGADGRGQRQITTFGYRPRWSPSGQYLLFSSSSLEVPTPDLYTVNIDGGAPRRFRPDVVGSLRQRYAAWHPELDRVGIWGSGPDGPVFQTLAVAGGPPEVARLLPNVRQRIDALQIRLTHFTWAPSGRFLYFEGRTATGSNVWRITIDPRTNDWTAGPEPLTDGATVDGDVALSADGRSLAFSARTERTRLWALPFDPTRGTLTGEGEPVTMGNPGEYDAAAPPDGSRVAFRTERDGQQEVWERSITNGQERLLIASRDWVRTSPRWSPDGRRLAYVRRPNGPAADAVRASIGILAQESGRESLLAMPPNMNLVPDDWSADGKLLLLACGLRGTPGLGICVMSTARPDAPVTVVARDANRSLICPRFSPNQRWISFMAVERGHNSTSTLYVMPAQGGPWTKITDGLSYDDKPRWSPDGRAIYFLSDRGGFANVWGQRIDPVEGRQVGQPFKVTKFDSAERRLEPNLARVEIAVSRNRLFIPLTESESEVWTVTGLEP